MKVEFVATKKRPKNPNVRKILGKSIVIITIQQIDHNIRLFPYTQQNKKSIFFSWEQLNDIALN